MNRGSPFNVEDVHPPLNHRGPNLGTVHSTCWRCAFTAPPTRATTPTQIPMHVRKKNVSAKDSQPPSSDNDNGNPNSSEPLAVCGQIKRPIHTGVKLLRFASVKRYGAAVAVAAVFIILIPLAAARIKNRQTARCLPNRMGMWEDCSQTLAQNYCSQMQLVELRSEALVENLPPGLRGCSK